MKYCTKCGNQMLDEAVICPKCGCFTSDQNQLNLERKREQNSDGLKKAAKVLMIIGTVLSGFWLIPLAWTIPMTVVYCGKIKRNEHVSVGFKVCSLLFVSLIAGILMLVDDK